MNLTLPEKEKIKKKTIIYTIAAISCILAIVVVIGVQVLGDDIVDNIFGITKITKKTEAEESELKSNFANLFKNTLDGETKEKIQKTDETKDIVYSNYQKNQKSENNYDIKVVLPYINIKNSVVEEYNKKISSIFKEKTEETLKSTNNNVIYTVKYQAYIENNVLSLIIYSDLKENVSAQRVIVQTFNYNLLTNKEMSLKDIIDEYGLKENEVQNKINSDIQNENKKSESLKQLGYNIFSRDVESKIYKIENATEFFIHNNNLYIIYAYGNDKITSEMDLVII